ncbi:hypothetical protein [Bradyrhizobium iriomotense]|uniref:hypothetical protein n=1 Tax=Bradyrhizobium iriomotense TaxID=441950 RepID=UPI0024E0EC75|nr:hypothetical protein [Bradyrhizobium iriomotense]
MPARNGSCAALKTFAEGDAAPVALIEGILGDAHRKVSWEGRTYQEATGICGRVSRGKGAAPGYAFVSRRFRSLFVIAHVNSALLSEIKTLPGFPLSIFDMQHLRMFYILGITSRLEVPCRQRRKKDQHCGASAPTALILKLHRLTSALAHASRNSSLRIFRTASRGISFCPPFSAGRQPSATFRTRLLLMRLLKS